MFWNGDGCMFCEYIIKHLIVEFKWVDCIGCELYLNEPV